MGNVGFTLQLTSGLLDAAAKGGAHAHAGVHWNVVLPVLVAILFFGAFTTVYVMMRRPSFGERGVTRDAQQTLDVERVTSRP